MMKPPTELLFIGTFDEARQVSALSPSAQPRPGVVRWRRAEVMKREDDEHATTYPCMHPPYPAPTNTRSPNVLQVAKSQQKWLIVNIQALDEFASWMLNRDVWKNEEIAELVQVRACVIVPLDAL